MSRSMHYLTFVLVRPSVVDIEAEVAGLLLGSEDDPERRFETFMAPCYCVGSRAHSAGYEQFDATERGLEITALLKQARSGADREAEDALLAERYRAVQAIWSTRDDYERPDADCETCRGTGSWERTRDPARHVDWWQIGGRWDGLLRERSEVPVRSLLSGNAAPVADVLLARHFPAAVVTPDGQWYETGMPFPTDFLPLEERADEIAGQAAWEATVEALLRRYSLHLAVVVDCHT